MFLEDHMTGASTTGASCLFSWAYSYFQSIQQSLQAALRARTLSTLTTVDNQWHREKERCLIAAEKLAAMGFPITDFVANRYKVELWIEIHGSTLFRCRLKVAMWLGCNILYGGFRTRGCGYRDEAGTGRDDKVWSWTSCFYGRGQADREGVWE